MSNMHGNQRRMVGLPVSLAVIDRETRKKMKLRKMEEKGFAVEKISAGRCDVFRVSSPFSSYNH